MPEIKKAEAFRKEQKIFVIKAKQGEITCLLFDFMQIYPLLRTVAALALMT